MARRNPRERNRRIAVNQLAHALRALGHDGMSESIAESIAANFVDALTDHLLEAAVALISARLELHGLVKPRSKKGRK
jgi:hypothetical protein